ncbi:MAG: mandelate racemase/muconate lactonizing enzyme family protein [Lachnospiraceae bacterium]
MNNIFSHNEVIRIKKAVYYDIAPIPLPKPFKDGTGGIRKASFFNGWLKLYDQDGNCGQGPASQLFVDFFLPRLLKEEGKSNGEWINYFWWEIRNFGYQSPHVAELCSLDWILLDLLALRAKKPLHRFLGAKRDWARVYKGGGSVLDDDETLIEELLRFKEEGYTTTKFKVGGYGTKICGDIRRLEKVRRALGDGMEIAVDANQAWDADTAFHFVSEAKDYSVAWLEEPVHAYDMDALWSLRDNMNQSRITMQIAMGESVRSYHTHVAYVEHGVDHLQPARLCSLSEIMHVREYAHQNNCMVSTGGFPFQTAVLGTLYSEEELIEYHQPLNEVLVPYFSLVSEMREGRFYLPDEPGLPVKMDFQRLERDGLLKGIRYFYHE